MTREGYKKHKEVFDAWLNGEEIQFFSSNYNEWIDTENPVWDYNSEYRIKPTKLELEDCSFNEIEYKVDKIGKIVEVRVDRIKINNSRTKSTLFKDKEIAEAYAVLPKLIRLRDEYNKECEPLCNKSVYDKHVIYVTYDGRITTDYLRNTQFLLTFNSRAVMLKFLEDHRDLIEIAKPLL